MHRREIAMALARPDVTVIPVVVDGATMPKPDQLPQNIRGLIQQQSRAISDSAAHRRVDLDGLMADIRRVGRFEPKPLSTSNFTPTRPLAPIKNSGKVIAALWLLALIFFAAIAEEGMDHDTKVGGILFGAIALWLAVSGFKDIKAGLVKGRGRAIAAIVAPPNPRHRINRRRCKPLPHHLRWLRAPSRPNRRVGKSPHRLIGFKQLIFRAFGRTKTMGRFSTRSVRKITSPVCRNTTRSAFYRSTLSANPQEMN